MPLRFYKGRRRVWKPYRGWGFSWGLSAEIGIKGFILTLVKFRRYAWRVEEVWSWEFPRRLLWTRRRGLIREEEDRSRSLITG